MWINFLLAAWAVFATIVAIAGWRAANMNWRLYAAAAIAYQQKVSEEDFSAQSFRDAIRGGSQ